MTSRIRRQSLRDWFKDNPILGKDEPGVEINSGKTKYGDGKTRWNDLLFEKSYAIAESTMSSGI